MELENVLKDLFPEGSFEYETLVSTNKLIVGACPATAAAAKNHLISLDHGRVKLSSMYFILGRKITEKKSLMQSTYDAQYTTLVKRGRPSKDAIEAELRSINPEYAGYQKQIHELEELRDLVSMYIRCVDSSKSTVTEILRNIYRID